MDLAISPLDARYRAEERVLECTVYNIGSQESGEYKIVARDAGGRKLINQSFPSLPPPMNYETARQHIAIPVATPSQAITISLEGSEKEITLFNNKLVLTPDQLP